MKDKDTKRLKNNSEVKSNAPENREGRSSSITKGNTLGLSALDTVWVTPREVRKEFETEAGDDTFVVKE